MPMTTIQMLALGALAVVGFFTYVLPNIPHSFTIPLPNLPKKASSKLDSIEHVINLRDSSDDKKLVDACNALLQALIQVGK